MTVGLATELDCVEDVPVHDDKNQLLLGKMHVQDVAVGHLAASDVLAEVVDMIDGLLLHALEGSEVVHEPLDGADDMPEVVGKIAAALVDVGAGFENLAGSEVEHVAAEVNAAVVNVVAHILEDEVVNVAASEGVLLEQQALQMADDHLEQRLVDEP